MARANRHYIPGQIWHITHRCHKKEFLLKFDKDKRRWLHWLFEAKRRYETTILNYVVTSNHIHLLLADDKDRNTISKTIQLVACRCAQEYNIRKKRKGAFWEDRYHATAIQSGEHLLSCLVYIDLNMVRAGVVDHPKDWRFSGYNEIQKPKRKCAIIDHDKLIKLCRYKSFKTFKFMHEALVENILAGNRYKKQNCWTQSLAVGKKDFVTEIKDRLAIRAKGRRIESAEGSYELKEEVAAYNAFFDVKNSDIGSKNTCVWEQFP